MTSMTEDGRVVPDVRGHRGARVEHGLCPGHGPGPTPKPAALGLVVYPGSGQDAAQQGKDEGECYAWARQQTGIDPTVATAPAPVADAPKGGAVKGAARGAAKGAAVGAVGDDDRVRDEGNLDAGEGAAAGAAAGAAKGRRAQKKAGKQAEAQAQQAAQTAGRREEGHVQEGLGRLPRGSRLQREVTRIPIVHERGARRSIGRPVPRRRRRPSAAAAGGARPRPRPRRRPPGRVLRPAHVAAARRLGRLHGPDTAGRRRRAAGHALRRARPLPAGRPGAHPGRGHGAPREHDAHPLLPDFRGGPARAEGGLRSRRRKRRPPPRPGPALGADRRGGGRLDDPAARGRRIGRGARGEVGLERGRRRARVRRLVVPVREPPHLQRPPDRVALAPGPGLRAAEAHRPARSLDRADPSRRGRRPGIPEGPAEGLQPAGLRHLGGGGLAPRPRRAVPRRQPSCP